jgi:serine/threonine-protein kinase
VSAATLAKNPPRIEPMLATFVRASWTKTGGWYNRAPVESSAQRSPELSAGQRVGEYALDRELGRGGFGVVWKAHDRETGKLVAIKVLTRSDAELASRFAAEARAATQIGHANIIEVFGFGELPDGRQYYVMEHLDGETLDARIRRGKLAVAEALPILADVARALDAAHAKGIAHRDLKPENVFLVARGGTKLLDFGIAKLMDPTGVTHKTRTGLPLGTPHYMSPEQCHGHDVDHRTDFYAFGIVAYRMLTGAYPIDASNALAILSKQISDEPVPPSTLVPELGSGVDSVIAWLMKKDLRERPVDLATAMRMFDVAAAGRSVVIPRASFDELAGVTMPDRPNLMTRTLPEKVVAISAPVDLRQPRRSRGKWIAVALVVAVAIVASWLVLRSMKQDREAEEAEAAGEEETVPDDAAADPPLTK